MMDRNKLENAISSLRANLDSENQGESIYQKWFEENTIVFDIMGYRKVIAHPKLRDNQGENLPIPDFLLQKLDGTWEVFELKRPDTDVLKTAAYRQTFYASFESYIAQCRDYSKHFKEQRNRQFFFQEHGAKIQQEVSCVIVAGRNRGLDRLRINDLISEYKTVFSHQTYDDVLLRLEEAHTKVYGDTENLLGLSIHMLIAPWPVVFRKNFIADIGEFEDKNRASVYIDELDRLHFDIIDDNGKRWDSSIDIRGRIQYKSPVYLGFELGTGPSSSTKNIDINGSYVLQEKNSSH